jgi:Matrixin
MFRARRTAARLLLAFSAAHLPGCGGGGSTPSAPAAVPATPTPVPSPVARDGLTHDIVAAAISPALPRPGDAVSATASDFLVREQRYDGTPLFLWPAYQGRDLDYTNQLVYHARFSDGSYRMVRWASSGFTVSLDDLGENSQVMDRTSEVVAEMVRRTGLPISIGNGGACRVLIDPSVLDRNAVATASWSFQGSTIVGATVRFANLRELAGGGRGDYVNTLLHEMGHVLGLGHSPDRREVMTPGEGPGTVSSEFQPGEAQSLHMMYFHRSAGNRSPDRDGALGAPSTAAARPVTVEIVD